MNMRTRILNLAITPLLLFAGVLIFNSQLAAQEDSSWRLSPQEINISVGEIVRCERSMIWQTNYQAQAGPSIALT
jgi:hypothetical protein